MTTTTIARTALALAIFAAPLSAQIDVRRPDHGKGRSTTTTTTSNGDIFRTGSVLGGTSRTSTHIPPGQLPPRGMCRVWIDGVPPGQQPTVTDCATARREALGRANARVIYGDEQSFPGNGKGKFKNKQKHRSSDRVSSARSCSVWDVVVRGGQQVPVCRDRTQQGRVLDRRGRGEDEDDDFDDDEQEERDSRFDRSDREQRSERHGKSKRGKGRGDD